MATATAAPTPCALSAPKLMTKLDPKTAEVPIFLRSECSDTVLYLLPILRIVWMDDYS